MAIDQSKLLPPGRPDTPEGRVDREGTPAGFVPEKLYGGITSSIQAINRNLIGITDILNQDLVQDQQDDQQKQRAEQQRVDNVKKGQKENFIESTIQNTLVKPVEKLAKKSKSVFARFFEALTAIFGGWLLDKGLKALKAWQEGDTGTLESIKNNVLKALAAAGGIFLLLNGGIPLIISGISALVGTIISSIPAILALLANPATWIAAGIIGAGIALGSFLTNEENQKSETSKNVEENVEKEGVSKTLEKLLKEQEELKNSGPMWWYEYYVRGRGLELEKQIKALQKGYRSGDDVNIGRGAPPDSKIATDIASLLATEDLKKNPPTPENLQVIDELTKTYQKLGGIKKAQTDLKKQLQQAKSSGDTTVVNEITASITKSEENFTKILQSTQGMADKLPDSQKLAVMAMLRQGLMGDTNIMPQEKDITGDHYEKIASLLEAFSTNYKPEPETPAQPAKPESSTTGPQKLEVVPFEDTAAEHSETKPIPEPPKAGAEAMSPPPPSALNETVTQPFKKNTQITLVPFDHQEQASGYPGDENFRDGPASSIPTLSTSNSSNEYLIHYRSVYGVD